jgi:hypothetical protein
MRAIKGRETVVLGVHGMHAEAVVAAKLVSAMDTGEVGRWASAGQTGLERVRVGGGTGRAFGLGPVG